jgi:hypothetical protein
MRAEYDFSKGRRGAVMPAKAKTRITIYIDDAVLDQFRAKAERSGAGYQTLMNEALKAYLEKNEKPVTAAVLRQIIREEVPGVSRLTRRTTRRAKTARR